MSGSKVSVAITNRAPGIQPPVYLAGNYSNPEWVPEPMEHTTSEDGVHTFTKTIQVEPESKIVYKFRVVTDDAGNRNNILEAPKANVVEEHAGAEEAAAEPVQTQPAELTEKTTEHVPRDTDANPEIVQPQAVSQVVALKHSDQVDPVRISTPEFIKTITEVSESAALLDRSTPEPGAPETSAENNEEQSSATLLPDAATTAAEVADSAALLDHPTPEPEGDVNAIDEGKKAPSEVAAEVADTAARLDEEVAREAPSEVAAQVADTAATLDNEDDQEAPSEVAAQVSDTAAKLDSGKAEAHSKTAPPTYKTLADVKADMKDESLEIAGFSNDHEPVPLFAHECAGLYEDDEIPGADEQGQSHASGHPYEDDKEDYNDPTLEKFPSTRDEIISTVRRVETGLNADQVSVEGVPLSPVMNSRGSPPTEARNEPRVSETSPISRGQQNLSLPPSLTAIDERSRSTTSLQSIAEDAEGAESAEESKIAEPQSEFIADVVEKPNGLHNTTTEIAEKIEAKPSEKSTADKVAPMVEQAETADEVIEVAHEAEGDQGKDIGVTSRDLSAAVELTLGAEDTASTIELPTANQDIASVIEQKNGAYGSTSTDLDTEKVQRIESDDIVRPNGEAGSDEDAAPKSKVNDADVILSAHKPALESVVTVPSPSVKPNTALLSPVSDDDEAIVVKVTKDEEKTKSGYLTPERAATPQPEEPGSPREPAPNTADPVAESDSESPVPQAEVEGLVTEPRSPQIVVSTPEETRLDEELLPAATLSEALDESGPADQDSESLKKDEVPAAESDQQISRESENSDDIGTSSNGEDHSAAKAPLDSKSSIGLQSSNDREAPATVNGSGEAAPHSANTATTSATEESQASTMKKRSVARPDPADRSGTPISITDSHKEAAKGGNWFSAFLRLIFIDFFGGFVRKITGGGRKTLVTTAVVLVAVGYASFRRATQTEEQVVLY